MSGNIEQDKCDFCKQIKPVQRFYVRVNDKGCDSIIIRYCKDHKPIEEQQIKELKEKNIDDNNGWEMDYQKTVELEYQVEDLKNLLDKSHNRGLTSEKHNKEVKQALK